MDFLKSPLGAFVLAVIGIGLAVYSTWYNEKKTELSIAILVASDVLNEQATVPGLEIRFDGRPLDQSKTPLKVALVRLWNSGDTTIRHADYDPNAPVGFRAENATVLWAALEQTTSDYLSKNASPKVQDTSSVVLPPVILEPKDVVSVKIIALQSQAGPLVVKPIGKVAGAGEITERITVRHPAGYIEAFRTPTEDKFHRYWSAFLVLASSVNLLVVLLLDWRKKSRARQSAQQPQGSGSGGAKPFARADLHRHGPASRWGSSSDSRGHAVGGPLSSNVGRHQC